MLFSKIYDVIITVCENLAKNASSECLKNDEKLIAPKL